MSEFLKNLRLPVSANVTEFRMVNDNVAQAIVVVSQDSKRDAIVEALTKNLENQCYPIQASFRWLEKGRSMIGFFASNQETRVLEEQEITAGYRVIATNMLMDKQDQTIWAVKEGAGGKYLTRQGQDDLSSLIESSRISPRGSVPRMQSVIQASANVREFVCFVNSSGNRLPSVDYGFVVARKDDQLAVATVDSRAPVNVRRDELVSVHSLNLTEALKEVQASGKKLPVVAASDTGSSVEYYRKLYSYAPDYLKKVIREIEEMAAM